MVGTKINSYLISVKAPGGKEFEYTWKDKSQTRALENARKSLAARFRVDGDVFEFTDIKCVKVK